MTYSHGNPLSSKYCRYLEKVCNLNSLDPRSKQWIVDQFLRVRSLDDLRYLCIHVQDKLRAIAANPDYFTV